ncbi:DinB family protein [Fulvivirgaceae bacterium BMA12]|uniref:DinB family protein n=1 Tax=Agaribacillus aureus TaxID=3051825 RepID=A0ABT8LHU9_9BACT|nr:DinB family protein [Fulvivirgaceae bacterium BMA12]
MRQIKWFDRKFDFSFDQNIFPSIIDRLSGVPIRLAHKVEAIPGEHLTIKPDNTWSIAENIGHLIDLEPLWQGRLEDILNGEKELREADLLNKKTDQANHNDQDVNELVQTFSGMRRATVAMLEALTEVEVYKFALHPRLKKPMRTMDLFLFVAEHDDHHLARITEINKMLSRHKTINQELHK